MGTGRRRVARRACLGVALGCVALSFAVPARAQEEEDPLVPEVFRGAASSQVASVEADRAALLPVDDVFRFIALDGTSVYETDLQTARASLFFPGNGMIQGPNLACGTFGGEFPPQFGPILTACSQFDYPLSVTANASTPDKATTGALALGAPTDPVSGKAVLAKAHAADDAATSDATMQDLRVLGLPGFGTVNLLPTEQLELDSSVLTVANATSRTDQRIDAGVLRVDTEAVMTGVRLIGGLIEIGSIRSTSSATDDAAGKRTADAALEIAGVTVAGMPAQITEEGLVVGSPAGSGPLQQQLQDALNQLLAAMRIKVTLLDVEEVVDDGTGQAVASAGGLLLEVAADAQNLPIIPGPLGDLDPNGTYVGSIQLGATAASAGATNFAEETFEDVPFDVGLDVPIDGGDATFGDVGLDFALPDAGRVVAPTTPDSSESQQALVRNVTDLFGGRMGLIYLAFAFSVLGVCIAPVTLPARLGGARP